MTVVACVKVWDGLVIAADSATTVPLPNGSHQVYNNANKIFHLHRKYPIAMATWGLGVLGTASIATVAKDLRKRFMGKETDRSDWELRDDYTLRGVADRVVEMMFDELYSPLVSSGQLPPMELSLLLVGYEGSGPSAPGEMWRLDFTTSDTRPIPQLVANGLQVGWEVYAIEDPAKRLFNGYDNDLYNLLMSSVDESERPKIDAALKSKTVQPVIPGMPFADAVRLAEFLASVTVGFAHFVPGPDIVGGEVEIAGITRAEGFKWINRKHYYPVHLNPKDPNHDV